MSEVQDPIDVEDLINNYARLGISSYEISLLTEFKADEIDRFLEGTEVKELQKTNSVVSLRSSRRRYMRRCWRNDRLNSSQKFEKIKVHIAQDYLKGKDVFTILGNARDIDSKNLGIEGEKFQTSYLSLHSVSELLEDADLDILSPVQLLEETAGYEDRKDIDPEGSIYWFLHQKEPRTLENITAFVELATEFKVSEEDMEFFLNQLIAEEEIRTGPGGYYLDTEYEGQKLYEGQENLLYEILVRSAIGVYKDRLVKGYLEKLDGFHE